MNEQNTFLADLILVIHFSWAAWMVVGIVLTIFGFWWKRFWRWAVFRTAHLVGMLLTGSTPLWAAGVCPLTEWEWQLRQGAIPVEREPFLIHWIRELLFYDVEPITLALVSGAAAIFVCVMYVVRPPWKAKRLQSA